MRSCVVVSSCAVESPPLDYGGLERVSALRARRLLLDGCNVSLFAKKGSYASWIMRYGRPAPRIYEFYSEEEYLRKKDVLEGADLIVDDSWLGLVYERYRDKTVKFWHAPLPPRMLELRGGYAVSKAHMDFVAEHGIPLHGYLHNVVDMDEFEGEPGDGGYLLYMNRITREKGALEFIGLCNDLKTRCVMIGDDIMVPDRGYVHRVIMMAQKSRYVTYMGRVGDRLKWIRNARALVAPLSKDYFEVFGLYVLEAFAYGKPVVAYDNGALGEVSKGRALLARDYRELKELVKNAEPDPELRSIAEEYDYRVARVA